MFGILKKKASPVPPQQVASPPPLPPEPPRAKAPNRFADPANDFERAMLAKHRREIDVHRFIEVLFNSSVYVLAPEGQFTGTSERPRLVANPRPFCIIDPKVTFLALFSSSERATPVRAHYPEFRYAVALHAGDFIMSLAPGAGLIINPYWDINFQWTPEQVAGIKSLVTKP
jgi:hypothetical protein